MNYTVTKLDRRHAWHKHFSYMIEFRKRTDWAIGYNGTGVLEFDQCRKWFNETWGWSQDVETREEMLKSIAKTHPANQDKLQDVNGHWSYSIRYGEYRIYVTDAALSLFKLKWNQDAAS